MAKRSKNLTLQDTVANQSKRKKSRRSAESGLVSSFAWCARISLLLAILLAPWLIGSEKCGAQLIIATLLLLGVGCWWIETVLTTKKRQYVPYLAVFVILGISIGFIQTLSLSEGFADLMAGRQLEFHESFFQGDSTAAPPIRLSMDVEGTWHQLRLLVIALVCVLLGCRYFRTAKHLKIFYTSVLINGVLLTAIGLLQKARSNGQLLWFYEVPETAAPFASFICRNNAAGYLVMCLAAGVGLFMLLITDQGSHKPQLIVSKDIPFWRQISTYLSMFAEKLDGTKIAILIACGFISVGVFASFSRGGVLTLLGGCIFAALIYNVTRKPKFAGLLLIPIAAITIMAAFVAGYGNDIIEKFEKIDSLAGSDSDARLSTWNDTLPAGFENGWFGSGLGSYRSIHRIYRSDPETAIFEYAENQYVQTIVEAGIPGIVLLGLAVIIGLWYTILLLVRGSSGTTVGTGVFASLLLGGQLVAAIFDFGWYIPANMVLFAAGMGIVSQQAHGLAGRLKKKSLLRFDCPNWLSQTLILSTFLLTIFVSYNLLRTTLLTTKLSTDFRHNTFEAFESTSLDEVNQKIKSLTPKVISAPTVQGLNYMGDLHVMRARMQYFDLLFNSSAYKASTDKLQNRLDKNIWNRTSLLRLNQAINRLQRQNEIGLANSLKSEYFFQFDLNQALNYYVASRKISPLQPDTQMLIGQLAMLLKDKKSAQIEIAKTLNLSPQNANFRLKCAISQLQSGETKTGLENLQHYLSLNRKRHFGRAMDLATGQSDWEITAIDNMRIADELIGDDPYLLHQFSKRYLETDDPVRMHVLKKANELLVDISLSDSGNLELKANLSLATGDNETGIEYLQKLVRSDPVKQKNRFRLARTLYDNGFYEEAEKQTSRLIRVNENHEPYKDLMEKVKKELKKIRDENNKANPKFGRLQSDINLAGSSS